MHTWSLQSSFTHRLSLYSAFQVTKHKSHRDIPFACVAALQQIVAIMDSSELDASFKDANKPAPEEREREDDQSTMHETTT